MTPAARAIVALLARQAYELAKAEAARAANLERGHNHDREEEEHAALEQAAV